MYWHSCPPGFMEGILAEFCAAAKQDVGAADIRSRKLYLTGMGSSAWGAHTHGSPMVHWATKRYNLNFITKYTIVLIFSRGNRNFYNFIGHIFGVQHWFNNVRSLHCVSIKSETVRTLILIEQDLHLAITPIHRGWNIAKIHVPMGLWHAVSSIWTV